MGGGGVSSFGSPCVMKQPWNLGFIESLIWCLAQANVLGDSKNVGQLGPVNHTESGCMIREGDTRDRQMGAIYRDDTSTTTRYWRRRLLTEGSETNRLSLTKFGFDCSN